MRLYSNVIRRHVRAFSQTHSIPSHMRAVVWRGNPDPGKMRLESLGTPSPKDGEVLVKVRACGVCHTDLHCIKGEVPFPAPAVFGHEISGTILQHGSGVDKTRLPLGGQVACTFIMPCGSCYHCKRGEEDTCAPFFALNRLKGQLFDGSTRLYQEGSPVAMYSFAGLAEYAVVPQTAAFLLPPVLAEEAFSESALLGCAFFTALGAIRNAAELRSGQSTVIVGAGGVGQGIVQLAKHLGASPVIAVDISEEALRLARSLGADHCINARQENVIERIGELTDGHRADVCIEVIGSKATFEQAIMAVRDGGRACYVGIASPKARAEVPITHVVRRRISLVGSYGARASKDMPELLEIAAKGGVNLKSAVTRRFSLDQASEAYKLLNDGKIAGRALIEVS
ncbi:Succinate-semialdehyde dehydrogenase (acetylating) [Symbiodinium microadriaticum]|uniref:Succinate-semialdehyde dehydrogenase (Acetylating) n=1 Tax=Symbiodinium microadriaticum TaxID=2951 RepID=A0A1Q9CQ39_SYMMI|nr:Succinate-semialdehyde dehydrogenase (acetylating) [Symbiodinium microadriaticum]